MSKTKSRRAFRNSKRFLFRKKIGKYENGSTMPNSETVIKMAKAFEISTDYLLLEEVNENPASTNLTQRI
ncbi:XRE family transcriptional regulator [Leptospira mayottensis]|nr:helix-turn-helix domain-containing protein [Leptospira mayottensis]AXR66660.1 XRE family transcriptional regulator [Leptospira mayottensis]AXR69590.1 XRE family transcriptional regulator [Leptospira mayottensis]AXR69604.1 XRE family transcriptional regulator [Leptospira mayottensis]